MKITMAHGSGGASSAKLMKDIFGKYFANEILDKMEDAAVLEVEGRIAFSTDSFVVKPIFFKGGNIGKLAVCGTVNDLLVMGAIPKYLTVSFIMEEGLLLSDLEKIVASMAEELSHTGVRIVAGDTKVVEGNGGLYINTTGIGMIPANRDVSIQNCEPGDVILLSGTLGDHHACILSSRMGIENQIQSDCAVLSDIIEPMFDNGILVKAMRDVTRGGLGTILNELAHSSSCHVEIEEKLLPIQDEVRGFCDILGLDPLYMGNEGKLIAVVPQAQAEEALALMQRGVHGKKAVVIGKITEGSGVSLVTRLGAKRMVDVLQGEGLPRIC